MAPAKLKLLPCNSSKTKLSLDIPGIDDSDIKGKANAINTKFAQVSEGLDPLDSGKLPAYFPAEEPPQLYPWEVFDELGKLKAAKSADPDQIPLRLLKEFAYELSVALTDTLNSSFLEGKVADQWKKAIVVPIPKQYPPNIDKLRPVVSCLCFWKKKKIAEGFVTGWVLDDVERKIDKGQFGNVKGVSTAQCLVSLCTLPSSGGR